MSQVCAICGDDRGGECIACGRETCFECMVPVRIAMSEGNVEGRITWKCKLCAAEFILSGKGERA